MEKTISSNQAGLIFCVFAISLKLSALPALMFSFSGNDSYITILIALIFDFIGTLIIVSIMHKHPSNNFYDILKKSFGVVFTKIVHIILLLYFFAKCVLVLQELHDYFIATLFEELNPVFFIIVLGLLMLFASMKNFRTVGRLIELIFWPTLIGIGFTLIFPVEDIMIEYLLPILEQGPEPILLGLSRTTFAFGDYMILLPLMGATITDKKSKKKILLYAFSALQFIFSFFVIFVGSFGKFSMSQTLALGELPLHNSTPATIGKLEWLTIIIWTVILLTSSIILAIACRETFDKIFNVSDKKWTCYVTTFLIMGVVAITYLQLETIISVAVSPIFSSISGGIQLLFIVILIIASIVISHKNKPLTSLPTPQRELSVEERNRC